MDRQHIEQLVRALYAARVEGRLDSLCLLFASEAHFRIAGSSDGRPIAISARGIDEIRSWLAILVKTFRLTDQEILSTVIDGSVAAVHWRADVHAKITGAIAATEFVDLIDVGDDSIVSYREFFVPR